MIKRLKMLYNTCKDVFNDNHETAPSAEDINKITKIMDAFKPTDFGLHDDMPHFWRRNCLGNPAITYLHLYQDKNFSMGIYFFPATALLPLHDHDGMFVFSKLLCGTIQRKSYDFVVDAHSNTVAGASIRQEEQAEAEQPKLARMSLTVIDAHRQTIIFRPNDEGSVYLFVAVTACAVLDVHSPPFFDVDHRRFQYYSVFPFGDFTAAGLEVPEHEREHRVWIRQVEAPAEHSVIGEMFALPSEEHIIQIDNPELSTTCCSIVRERNPYQNLINSMIIVFFGLFAIIASYMTVKKDLGIWVTGMSISGIAGLAVLFSWLFAW